MGYPPFGRRPHSGNLSVNTEKLFALKEKGVLTEEEFEKEKKKILSE